jgi:hypothetical protein
MMPAGEFFLSRLVFDPEWFTDRQEKVGKKLYHHTQTCFPCTLPPRALVDLPCCGGR